MVEGREASHSGVAAVDVAKSYRTGLHTVEVLKGISLTMEHGESLVITGPSGSGKSTLLHILGGLDTPTRGRVMLDGLCPQEMDDTGLAAFRNRYVGFVFQDHHLLPQFTVRQNVLLPTAAAGRRHETDREAGARAEGLLDAVGLSGRLDHRPAELSGGERQRVAIARALINSPKLLLCDEPTGNLDSRTAATVTDLLFALHEEAANMLIVVTHSNDLADRFPRRVEMLDGLLGTPTAA